MGTLLEGYVMWSTSLPLHSGFLAFVLSIRARWY
jgi:hypothetical protein